VNEARPPVWVGHIALAVRDLERSTAFWSALGMREVERNPRVTVLELRGGTHLVLYPADGDAAAGGAAGFDLMVEDLASTHAAWESAGLQPSPIVRGRIHDTFTVVDPDGWVVTVNSTHVAGVV
jgi:catechol 2,3-dioxygenase-like lactoylglutathione lyase family enzyme